jgi:hypothetical protein
MIRRAGPALVAVALICGITACGAEPRVPTSGSSTAPAAGECPVPDSGFECDLQRRIVAVRDWVAGRPGEVGVVVRDRATGAVWRNEHAGTPVWTASTIKLAMVVDLLLRRRAGEVELSEADLALVDAMLHSSDDRAADELWLRHGGPDHTAFNAAFGEYGMTSLTPQEGYGDTFPYWGFQKCTADDLDRLMSFVLSDLPAEDREFVVRRMRSVGEEQRWGVWGAGPAAEPGTKNGWSLEADGWVMNTVGFAGPGERYTLAVMNALGGEGGYDEGRETDTGIARLLFGP